MSLTSACIGRGPSFVAEDPKLMNGFSADAQCLLNNRERRIAWPSCEKRSASRAERFYWLLLSPRVLQILPPRWHKIFLPNREKRNQSKSLVSAASAATAVVHDISSPCAESGSASASLKRCTRYLFLPCTIDTYWCESPLLLAGTKQVACRRSVPSASGTPSSAASTAPTTSSGAATSGTTRWNLSRRSSEFCAWNNAHVPLPPSCFFSPPLSLPLSLLISLLFRLLTSLSPVLPSLAENHEIPPTPAWRTGGVDFSVYIHLFP